MKPERVVDSCAGLPHLRCGEQTWPANACQRQFCTRQYALVWVERGSCVVQYPGMEPLTVCAGQAFKRLPDEPHDVTSAAGCRNRFVAVPRAVCDLFEECRVPGWRQRVISPGNDPAIAAGFRSIREDLNQHAGAELMRVLVRMQAFIADLHQRAVMGDEQQAPIRAACEQLRASDDQPIPAIAAACGMAYSTFRQRFQAVMGCSPRTYRIRTRIEQAQHLLLSGLTVGAVADRLGYCDAFRFSAQFKQFSGASPRQWLRREQGLRTIGPL